MARRVARAMRWALAAGIIGAAAAMGPGTAVLGAAAHSFDLTVVAGKNASDGGFDFNGYQSGAMTVTVPTGWQVAVHFENVHFQRHSLIVLPPGADKQAAPSSTPVFPGAVTKDLATGLPKGAKQTLTFQASKAGTYELVCGVPGHAAAGMWDKLIVSDTATTATAPSVTPAGAATIAAVGAH